MWGIFQQMEFILGEPTSTWRHLQNMSWIDEQEAKLRVPEFGCRFPLIFPF